MQRRFARRPLHNDTSSKLTSWNDTQRLIRGLARKTEPLSESDQQQVLVQIRRLRPPSNRDDPEFVLLWKDILSILQKNSQDASFVSSLMECVGNRKLPIPSSLFSTLHRNLALYGTLCSYWLNCDGKSLSAIELEHFLADSLLPSLSLVPMESGVSSSDSNDTLHSLLSCIHSLFLSTLLFPFLQERNCPSSLSSSTVLCLQRLLQLDPVDLPSQLLQLHALSYATQHAFPALLHSSFPARTLHFALERLRPFSRNTDEKVAIATLQLIRVCHSCSAFSLDRVTDLRTIFTWVVENEVSLPAGNEALSTVRVVLKKTSLPDLEGVLAGFIEWSFRFFSSLQPSSLQSSSLQSSSLQSSSLQSSSL
ncbi:hypothetical protein WA588_001518, partial [Blastocystis sp. NMH]